MCKEDVGRSSLLIVILGTRGVCLNYVRKGWDVGGWKDPWKRQRGEMSNSCCYFIKGGFRMQNSLQSWLNVIHCFLLLSVFYTILLQYVPEWLQWKRNPFKLGSKIYQCVNLPHEWDARDIHMIRKKSLIIAAASTQINLNHSINFFPFFLSFSFFLSWSGCADIRTWAVTQTCLIVLYCSFPCKFFMSSVLFPANFSCSLRQRRALITEVLKSVIFPFVFNWHHIKLNICTKRATYFSA